MARYFCQFLQISLQVLVAFDVDKYEILIIVHCIVVMHYEGHGTEQGQQPVFIEPFPALTGVCSVKSHPFSAVKPHAASFLVDKDHRIVPVQDKFWCQSTFNVCSKYIQFSGGLFLHAYDEGLAWMELSWKETVKKLFHPVNTDKTKIKERKDHRLQGAPVLAFLLKTVLNSGTGLLSAVPASVSGKFMPLLYDLYFIIQHIFVITSDLFQLTATVRADIQGMLLCIGHFIVRNRGKSVLFMSGLSAFSQIGFLPGVRDMFLFVRCCLAGRVTAVCTVVIKNRGQPGYFIWQSPDLLFSIGTSVFLKCFQLFSQILIFFFQAGIFFFQIHSAEIIMHVPIAFLFPPVMVPVTFFFSRFKHLGQAVDLFKILHFFVRRIESWRCLIKSFL